MFTVVAVVLSTSDGDNLVGNVNTVVAVFVGNVGVVVGSGLLVMALMKVVIYFQLKTIKRYMHDMKHIGLNRCVFDETSSCY